MASPVEPNIVLQNAAIWLPPFIAYFLGIWIRKRALPGRHSLDLSRQLLLGIPISFAVVTPLIELLLNGAELPQYLTTLGLAMEHGMIVNETLTHRLNKKLERPPRHRPPPPVRKPSKPPRAAAASAATAK
jgi:hypothetical protein